MAAEDLAPGEIVLPTASALGATLEGIVGLGNRFAGTVGERRAREYLADAFQRRGLERVRVEPFTFLAYEPQRARCELLPTGVSMPCCGLQYTASAAVEGEVVYVGKGTEDEIAALEARGVELRDKVVMAHAVHPWLVMPRLAARGACAVVNVSEAPDGLIGHFPASYYPLPHERPWPGVVLDIPGVTLEAEAGRRLLSLMSASRVRLRVDHRARHVERESGNVVGEVAGTSLPEERVVIGAHYDTQAEGPGAADNGTGLAALLELVASIRTLRPRRTVVFAAWGVEELGIWGSYAYVRSHMAEHAKTVGMINLDALGLPSPGTRLVVADGSIADFAVESATRVGWVPEGGIDASVNAWSDHNPFLDAGVPAVWYWRYPPQHPYYHTAGDVMRYVDLRRVEDVAQASGYLAARLASLPEVTLGRAVRTRVHAQLPFS
ncbi:M20/M25/M40 family metallo-hydrolase [Baekduia alba]|uniref:M20/M25/M40 family metallo-hydrolase n=1 Tax=Baekduia alba TaxID=2997333 RepID=UPI0023418861|nr:M20/M25/M40 family metallo-hydrolase [Baekduia alba]